jgi:hypothetical protein
MEIARPSRIFHLSLNCFKWRTVCHGEMHFRPPIRRTEWEREAMTARRSCAYDFARDFICRTLRSEQSIKFGLAAFDRED